MLTAGMRVGPYEVVAPIGAGGMGEVYRARDPRLRRDVAIKVLPLEFATDPDRLRRFEQEARAVAALNHPNILAIYDVGTHEGAPYIVAELLEGESLHDRLRSGGLPVRKAVETAVQIAQGLAAAHEKGIIHRDLKPGNLFVTRDGHVKILDFGIAKLTRPESAPDPYAKTSSGEPTTDSGAVLGTLGYTSPEQLRGQPADARSDIFSFGCVLYQMLSGRFPFLKRTGPETASAILTEDPLPLAASGRPVAPALQEIVSRCLEKRPEERFSSAHDLALALRAYSGGAEAPATVPTRVLRAPRRRLLGVLGVLIVGVAAALLIWTPWRRPAPALDPKRVVVAPFENRTGDPSLESFGSLIAEAVTRNAALAGGAAVVPGTSFAAKGADRASGAALRALAKESGTGLVVSGAYYVAGDDLRIQAQLFDASHGSVLVTFEPITGSRRAASTLLEPLRQRVLGAVACFGSDAMFDPRLIHIPTLDAWVEFMHGYELYAVDYPKAIAHFNRASELDPDFFFGQGFALPAYANLGQCEDMARVLADLESRLEKFTNFERLWVAWGRAFYEGRSAMALQLVQEMERSVARGTGGGVSYSLRFQRANHELSLNLARQAATTLAGIPTSWMPVTITYNWWAPANLAFAYHRLEEYETELKVANQGLHEYPDVLDLYIAKNRALAALGRLAEIDRVVDEALAVKGRGDYSSAGGVMRTAAAELRAHGHPEASLRMAERAVAWYRARPAAEAGEYQYGLMSALFWSERWAEAKAIADALLAKSPDDINLLGWVGCLAARLGDTAQARQVAAKLRDRKSDCQDRRATYQRACIAAQLGEKREAMALLREAVARGYDDWDLIHFDRDLEPLWGDAEFKELVRPKG